MVGNVVADPIVLRLGDLLCVKVSGNGQFDITKVVEYVSQSCQQFKAEMYQQEPFNPLRYISRSTEIVLLNNVICTPEKTKLGNGPLIINLNEEEFTDIQNGLITDMICISESM